MRFNLPAAPVPQRHEAAVFEGGEVHVAQPLVIARPEDGWIADAEIQRRHLFDRCTDIRTLRVRSHCFQDAHQQFGVEEALEAGEAVGLGIITLLLGQGRQEIAKPVHQAPILLHGGQGGVFV